MRMCEIDKRATVNIGGSTAIVVPTGTRTGGFSKPISPESDSPAAALAARSDMSRRDVLIRRLANGRWQLWGRSANARGVHRHVGDYEFHGQPGSTVIGRRAKRRPAGSGQLYIEA